MGATSLAAESSGRFRPIAGKVTLVSVVMACQVGTGGASTLEYLEHRGLMGYAYSNYSVQSHRDRSSKTDVNPTGARSPNEDLAHFRNIFRPSVTDLAHALGVSRQAVYDWQSGKPIALENAARLADLGRAADIFTREGLTATAQVLRRPITSGKSLLQLVHGGESAEESILELVTILKQEALQRERLNVRFAGRPSPPRKAFEDIGTPIVREDV